jgi:prevent-host-death family protein
MAEHRVSTGRLKARLSEYLRLAREGAAVVVTERGEGS